MDFLGRAKREIVHSVVEAARDRIKQTPQTIARGAAATYLCFPAYRAVKSHGIYAYIAAPHAVQIRAFKRNRLADKQLGTERSEKPSRYMPPKKLPPKRSRSMQTVSVRIRLIYLRSSASTASPRYHCRRDPTAGQRTKHGLALTAKRLRLKIQTYEFVSFALFIISWQHRDRRASADSPCRSQNNSCRAGVTLDCVIGALSAAFSLSVKRALEYYISLGKAAHYRLRVIIAITVR